MRHKISGRKLGRNPSHRRAMLRNMVTSFLEHERLVTTLPKAKELRPIAEKMITLGKRDTLHARRQVKAYLMSDEITKKVFDTIAPRFSDRPGGYSRIIRYRNRVGDGAEEAIIELLGSGVAERSGAEDSAETAETVEASNDTTEDVDSATEAEASSPSTASAESDGSDVSDGSDAAAEEKA